MPYRYDSNRSMLAVLLILVILGAVYFSMKGGIIQPTPQNQTVYVDIRDYPSPKVYISVEKIGLVTDNGIYFVLNNSVRPMDLNLTALINRTKTVGAIVIPPTNITGIIICINRTIIFHPLYSRNLTFFKHKFYTMNFSSQLNFSQELEKIEEEFREREKMLWWEGKTPPWYWNKSKVYSPSEFPLPPWNISLNSTKCIIIPLHRAIVINPAQIPIHHVVIDINVDVNRTVRDGSTVVDINVTKG